MRNKKNLLYSISANLMSTLVSALIALILPKYLTVESYGAFQYFLFWSGYLGLLHFGWIDGIYLVHCGEYYDQLEKEKIKGQLLLFAIVQVSISIGLMTATNAAVIGLGHTNIFISVALLLPITNLRLFFLYLLQATARIREYSRATIAGLVCNIFGLITLILLGRRDYSSYICINILSNAVALVSAVSFCRDILSKKALWFGSSVHYAIEYIVIGHRILIANFASSWIVGIVRLMVERRWDLATFGKISLTLTVSNMFMTLINAIALVILPALRRLDDSRLVKLYEKLNTLILVTIFGLMTLYYPAQMVLSSWLPDYASSLSYMGLLFPICFFEGKNALLLNTYLKALRKERQVMWINLACVLLSVVLSCYSVIIVGSMTLTMFFIVVSIATRCFVFELAVQSRTSINVLNDIAIEISMASIFIITNWFVGGLIGLALYLMAFTFLCVMKRSEIVSSFIFLVEK